MTKENIVKEAYTAIGVWEQVKEFADENGVITIIANNIFISPTFLELGLSMYYCGKNILSWYDINTNSHYWQLKCLDKIENNNGWMKISSIDDLPTYETKKYLIGKFLAKDEFYQWYSTYSALDVKTGYELQDITHYREAVFVKPPLH